MIESSALAHLPQCETRFAFFVGWASSLLSLFATRLVFSLVFCGVNPDIGSL